MAIVDDSGVPRTTNSSSDHHHHHHHHHHHRSSSTVTINHAAHHNDNDSADKSSQQYSNGDTNVVLKMANGRIKQNPQNDWNEGFKRDMKELEDLLSKLNPMAKEFVPSSLTHNAAAAGGGGVARNGFHHFGPGAGANGGPGFGHPNGFLPQPAFAGVDANNGNVMIKRKNSFSLGKRRINNRTTMAQREDIIRRTVYVSDIDQQVTEEQLAALFLNCGQVVDCRICGDPNSVLRFAFVEFTDEEGARASLHLSGTMLGFYPVKVLPSKTAIAPVNPTFLPRSEDEREMCARTIYCTNIDKKISQAELRLFFESVCGQVRCLRLLGDYNHSTRIAFVEFVLAESAILALNCSGVILGCLPIRVSPSKTPVRPRAPRQAFH